MSCRNKLGVPFATFNKENGRHDLGESEEINFL